MLISTQQAAASLAAMVGQTTWLVVLPEPLQPEASLRLLAMAAPDHAPLVFDLRSTHNLLQQFIQQHPHILWVSYRSQVLCKRLHAWWPPLAMRWACVEIYEQLLGEGVCTPIELTQLGQRYQLPGLTCPHLRSLQALQAAVAAMLQLVTLQRQQLKAKQLDRVCRVENAVIPVLAHMEQGGMPFDRQRWQQGIAAETAQLQTLPPRSAAAQQLRQRLSVCGHNFLEYCSSDARIHPSFTQLGSKTGRIVCRRPPLQAIAHDTWRRRCFSPEPSRCLVLADYRACELRIAAELSEDPNLLQLGNLPGDLHGSIANAMGFDATTERQTIKIIGFAIIYGMQPTSLAKALRTSVTKAQVLMQRYRCFFPQLFAYLERHNQQTAQTRVCCSLLGRRLRFAATSPWQEHARTARNMPIQASNADILKLALGYFFAQRQTGWQIVHAIHDEIIVECPRAERQQVALGLQAAMQRAASDVLKKITLPTEVTIAANWQLEPLSPEPRLC